MDLVEAQETRRILDRLYGYEVTPVLWKKVMTGLSAGRVQSVATRLVVERERERMAFRVASYWDLEAHLRRRQRPRPADVPRQAALASTATASPAAPTSTTPAQLKAKRRASSTSTSRAPRRWPPACSDTTFAVRSVESKPYRRSPYAPFRTTTLQQEASRKLGLSASRDDAGRPAALRERLHHLHAYRLHDAVGHAPSARPASQVRELYGAEYLPDAPRVYAAQGQERPGGARGDPPRRRDRSAPRRRPA